MQRKTDTHRLPSESAPAEHVVVGANQSGGHDARVLCMCRQVELTGMLSRYLTRNS